MLSDDAGQLRDELVAAIRAGRELPVECDEDIAGTFLKDLTERFVLIPRTEDRARHAQRGSIPRLPVMVTYSGRVSVLLAFFATAIVVVPHAGAYYPFQHHAVYALQHLAVDGLGFFVVALVGCWLVLGAVPRLMRLLFPLEGNGTERDLRF